MSYGMVILNADGRVQINTDEIAPNTYINSKTASAYTAMSYPPAGTAAGDLVLAKPATNPVLYGGGVPICLGQPLGGQKYFYGAKAYQDAGYTYLWANTSGINTALLKTQAGNIPGPAAGEHGLDVYSTDGSTILFSATRSTSVRVLAQGVLTSGQNFTYSLPAGLDFTKIYAVVNSTMLYVQPAVFVFPSWVVEMSYTFYPTAGIPYIKIINETRSNGSLVSSPGVFPYVLVYDPN